MKYLVRWRMDGETLVDEDTEESAKDRVTELISEMPDCGLHSADQSSEIDEPQILSAVVVDRGSS